MLHSLHTSECGPANFFAPPPQKKKFHMLVVYLITWCLTAVHARKWAWNFLWRILSILRLLECYPNGGKNCVWNQVELVCIAHVYYVLKSENFRVWVYRRRERKQILWHCCKFQLHFLFFFVFFSCKLTKNIGSYFCFCVTIVIRCSLALVSLRRRHRTSIVE